MASGNKYEVPRWSSLTRWSTGANFEMVISQLRDRLNANAVPMQMTIGSEDEFGVVDLVKMKSII